MAFEGLTEKLNATFKKLRGKGRLTENDVREAMRSHLDAIQSAAAEIKTINYRQYEDQRLTELAERIRDEAAALKE